MFSTTEKQKIKYFMYLRKSSEDKNSQVASIPAQELELKEIAKREGLKIVDIYRETQSAHSPGRPLFNEMLERIEKDEANGILVWNANRIARNIMDAGVFITLMDKKKILAVKAKDKVYYNTSNDKFFLVLEFGISKKYSDDLSDIVKRGNRYKFFEKKEWSGCAKPGYINKTDKITKKGYIDVDSDRFNLLKEAAMLIISGKNTPMEALNTLNNKWKYRSRRTAMLGGKPLSRAAFYRFLTDPYYYGLMVRKIDNKVCSQIGTHTPMFTKDEFDLLQIRLGKKGKHHYSDKNFPFKGILRCGECGGNITCQEKWQIICSNCKKKFHKGKLTTECLYCGVLIEKMNKPKLLHYVYYGCIKRTNPNCSQGNIEIKRLEKQIDEELKKFEIPEEFKDWAIKYINELNDHDELNETSVRDNLMKQLTDCDKQLRNLLKLRISPKNAYLEQERQAFYDEEEKRLLKEKADIMAKIKHSDEHQKKWIELTKESFNFACYARYWFAKGDVKTKTGILAKLGENLTIRDKKLCLDQPKPYFFIQKAKEEIEAIVKKLEPEKEIVPAIQMLNLEPVLLTLRENIYKVRT